jgi:hypothetical protein
MSVRNGWAGFVVIAGLALALAQWGWQFMLAFILAAGFMVVVAVAVLTEGRMRLRRIIVVSLLVSALPLVAAGWMATLGWAGAMVVLVALVLAARLLSPHLPLPKAWRLGSRDAQPSWDAPDASLEPHPGDSHLIAQAPDTEALDDSALCLAWRRSFIRLDAARTLSTRLAIVEQRQKYLDELQRRHAEGFERWLRSGARASGNPLPYLHEEPHQPGAAEPLRDNHQEPGLP